MTTFAWKGRNPRGEMVQGMLEADNDGAVANQLLAVGVTPLAIDARALGAAQGTASAWEMLRAAPVNDEDLLLFSRQMYTLQRAGVPILRALAGLQASTPKRSLVALLADLRASLDQGR